MKFKSYPALSLWIVAILALVALALCKLIHPLWCALPLAIPLAFVWCTWLSNEVFQITVHLTEHKSKALKKRMDELEKQLNETQKKDAQ